MSAPTSRTFRPAVGVSHKRTAPSVRACGLSASWSNDRAKLVLKDINFEVSEVIMIAENTINMYITPP